MTAVGETVAAPPGTSDGAAVAGRVLDLDSHEMIPAHMWPEAFGPSAELLAPLTRGLISRAGANSTVRDDIIGDESPITAASVWETKGPEAPSAIDLRRRPAVLDAMGIRRQLLFPTFALIGINLCYNRAAADYFGFDPADMDPVTAGRAAVTGYNEWAAGTVRALEGDRLRPVAIVLTDSLEAMMSGLEWAIENGLRALWIPSGVSPAGTSPADSALDTFWKLAEESKTSVLLHVGTEFGFLDPGWYRNVDAFSYGPRASIEFPIEPYRASTIHLAIEAFVGAMVMGGVFERFPALRFGVIECGAHWVGPLAEKLDLWSGQFGSRLESTLRQSPSKYLARNVRVTPFSFEPVGEYMARFPDVSDCFAYGSDFPHVEGGKNSFETFSNQLRPFGGDPVDKFFVRNGELILGD